MHPGSLLTPRTAGVPLGMRRIADDLPVYVVAEAGVNHNGKLDEALRLVDAAAWAGADAVKFQIFHADELTLADAPAAGYQRRTRARSQRELLRRLELSDRDWRRIRQRCRELRIDFIATPFSVRDLERLAALEPVALKIASTDIDHYPLLRQAATLGLPILLSTGAAELDEVETAVGWLDELGAGERLVLLHCVSSYPTPWHAVNLRAIGTLRQHFDRPTGFSDHTTGVESAALAVAAGACLLEKHFTLDRAARGPDHALSLEPDDLRAYIRAARTAEAARGDGRITVAPIERDVRGVSRRSLVTTRPLPAGAELTEDDLTAKRPAGGISPACWPDVLGRRLRRSLPAETILRWEMIE